MLLTLFCLLGWIITGCALWRTTTTLRYYAAWKMKVEKYMSDNSVNVSGLQTAVENSKTAILQLEARVTAHETKDAQTVKDANQIAADLQTKLDAALAGTNVPDPAVVSAVNAAIQSLTDLAANVNAFDPDVSAPPTVQSA